MCADLRVCGSHPNPERLSPRALLPLYRRVMAAHRRRHVEDVLGHRAGQHLEKKNEIEEAVKRMLGDQAIPGRAQKPTVERLQGGWQNPALRSLHDEISKAKDAIDRGEAPARRSRIQELHDRAKAEQAART